MTKVLIAKLIRSPIMADVRIWMINFAVDYLSDHFIKPAMDYFFRKLSLKYEVQNGKHILRQINDADTVDEWDRATDRL